MAKIHGQNPAVKIQLYEDRYRLILFRVRVIILTVIVFDSAL